MSKGYLYLLLASFCYASMGILVKMISVDTGPYLQTFLRLIVAALLTAGLVAIRKKPFLLKNNSDYPLMLLMGSIGYGLQIILFTLAIYHTTIGNTLFLMSIYPITSALLAYLLLKEQINRNLFIAFSIMCVSLFLLFQPGGLGTSLLGNLYAIGVGITFSFYVIWSRMLSKRGNAAETITLWSIIIGVVVSGIAAATFETITLALSTQSLIFLIAFGILNAAAFTFINKGFAIVAAGIGTMILMSEPIIGSILALLFFQEIPTLLFLIGAGLLILSVTLAVKK